MTERNWYFCEKHSERVTEIICKSRKKSGRNGCSTCDKVQIDTTNHLPPDMALHCQHVSALAIEDGMDFKEAVHNLLDNICAAN